MEVKRYDLLNHLIDTYGFVNYLEIGIWAGECIKSVKAEHKDGVDPGIEGNIHEYLPNECNYKISSDRFFELIEGEDIKYDLQPNGIIMLHDCNPQTYESQVVPRMSSVWHGDVWKAYVGFKQTHPQFNCYVVDTDCGCGIIVNNKDHTQIPVDLDLDYKTLEENRIELLNLISVDEFKEIFS